MIERVFSRRLTCALAVAPLVAALLAPLPSAGASASANAHITFAGVPWASTRRSVRARFEAAGLTYVSSTPDDYFHGKVNGAGATVVCIFTPEDELTFVRVFFDDGSPIPDVYGMLAQNYGTAAHCDAEHRLCRWERGTEEVTLTANPAAAPVPNTPNIEYSDTDLAYRYDVEINHKEHQYHDKSDM